MRNQSKAVEDILSDILNVLEEMNANIANLTKRDKCKYLCRDRGRHSMECDYLKDSNE